MPRHLRPCLSLFLLTLALAAEKSVSLGRQGETAARNQEQGTINPSALIKDFPDTPPAYRLNDDLFT